MIVQGVPCMKEPSKGEAARGFMKIVLAGLVIVLVIVGGCTALIGLGAKSASDAIITAH